MRALVDAALVLSRVGGEAASGLGRVLGVVADHLEDGVKLKFDENKCSYCPIDDGYPCVLDCAKAMADYEAENEVHEPAMESDGPDAAKPYDYDTLADWEKELLRATSPGRSSSPLASDPGPEVGVTPRTSTSGPLSFDFLVDILTEVAAIHGGTTVDMETVRCSCGDEISGCDYPITSHQYHVARAQAAVVINAISMAQK